MPVDVVSYSDEWPVQFATVVAELRRALREVPLVAIEHVGSTAVPGLVAKPILDIDIVVRRQHVGPAIAALGAAGYLHRGDLGVTDREAMASPDDQPARNVYICVDATVRLRNHLAVRDILRRRYDLRDKYGAVKLQLASDPDMDIVSYIAKKSSILQDVLAESDLSAEEKALILALNTGGGQSQVYDQPHDSPR
ncbi:GrpB family protein [Leifsonia xyli]|uniref:GrpB family protein n=1 Tax=Leifsonia xyli TaxID=1575 RepID=UPI003D672BA9